MKFGEKLKIASKANLIVNLYTMINFFFLYIKMRTKYDQNHKEKLRKEARERYQNLSEK